MLRSGPSRVGVKTEAESSAKAENIINAKTAASGVLQSAIESASQIVKLAMKLCRLVWDTFFSELEDWHGLETGFALHQNMNLGLASYLCSSSIARGQDSFAQDTPCKVHIREAVRRMSVLMAREARGHILRSDLTLFCCNRSLCWKTGMAGNVLADPERLRKRL